MKSAEFYKIQAKDILETVLYQDTESFGKNLKDIFSPTSLKKVKLKGLFGILKKMVSEQRIEKLKNRLLNLTNLTSINTDKFTFINKIDVGSESAIYLLKSRDDKFSYVFKILLPYKYTEGNDKDSVIKLAKKRKQEMDEYYKMFSSMPSLILREHLVVIDNPKKGKNEAIIIAIQKFIGYDQKNLFRISTEEIKKMCDNNSEFKKEFEKLVQIVTEKYMTDKKIIDTIGNNVLVIQTLEGKPHILVIDPHDMISTNTKDTSQQVSLAQ